MAEQAALFLQRLSNPPRACRPAIFWLLNGRLSSERIRDQIRQMRDAGLGGFFLHPMGESFRLGDFLEGISPPYLSDEYFVMLRLAVEEAERLGMYAWLYDEGGWPSGTAQGQVIAGHPELRAQVLRVNGEGEPIAQVTVGDRTLTFTADVLDRPDHLNPAAVRRFIETTHERYAAHLGQFFGGTIPGIFTDETAVPGRVGSAEVPWTPGMMELFAERTGRSLEALLPALFSDDALGLQLSSHMPAEEIYAVRCEFCELWTDLFEAAYWRQINDWCAAHNLIHCGHVGGEDTLPQHAASFGHFFKTAGALHAPGVDAIWRQIFPGADNFCFPLLASSAMAQRPDRHVPGAEEWAGLVLSESYAVYGYGLTLEQMRWVADYQALRGVNYLLPMAFYYDTSRGRFVGTMSHLGEGNPLWEHFDSLTDHVATLSAAVRHSDLQVTVAIYWPIEAAWLGEEVAQAAWLCLRNLTDALERRQVPFEFIDARSIENATVADGLMDTGGRLYSTVIVPETPVLRSQTMAQLAQFRLRGGRVAFCTRVPEAAADLSGGERFREALDALLAGAVKMDGARARVQMGTEDARGLGPDTTSMIDGFTAAYFGASSEPVFTEAEIAAGACLVVPPREIPRLAELIPWVLGRHELLALEHYPDLRMSPRACDDLGVHLLHNEADLPRTFRFMLVSDTPRVVQRWDTLTGEPQVLAVHAQVSEGTEFAVNLAAGESALLVTVPLSGPPPAIEPTPRYEPLTTTTGAQALEIVSETVITPDGALQVRGGRKLDLPSPFPLQPLEELGLGEFSGTVRYRLALMVPQGYENEPLALDLGEVGYVAQAWLNGEPLGVSAWPPHRTDITGLVCGGVNDLVVMVTNTLANQAACERVVQRAQEAGWFNVYYRRALPMMGESLRSGLIGPVRLLVRRV